MTVSIPISASSPGFQLHTELWKAAYERLDEDLRRRYEVLLKAELNADIDSNLDDQAVLLLERRKQRVENRQWTYRWRGRPRKVRDQVDTILDVVQKGSSIISVGMNFAPIFVSMPWTAITTLLPYITNDSKEHNMALEGLQQVSETMARYKIIEQMHIETSSVTFSKLKESITDLYSKIFRYQARLADYLGKNTLRRFGINSLQLGGWTELTQSILSADTLCQSWMRLHDLESAQIGVRSLAELMMEHTKGLEAIAYKLAKLNNERALTHKILSWITDHDAFEDYDDRRDRIGGAHLSSGQWLFHTTEYGIWEHSKFGVLILRGSVGTGKSSLISIIVEHLLNTSAGRLAFYYCSRAPMTDTSTRAVILSLLRQLAGTENTHNLNSEILDKYEIRTQKSWNQLSMPRNQLLDLMVDVLHDCPEAVIVVDALDECADPEDLLKFLDEVSYRTQNIRFLFSARPHIAIRSRLNHAVRIDELDVAEHTAEDIQDFMKIELALDSRAENEMPSLGQATALYDLIRKLASGMFRWVKLQVDLFLQIELPDDFDRALQRLAKTTLSLKGDDRAKLYAAYNDMYDANVGRKPTDLYAAQAEREAVVQRIFLWALCAHRPLRVSEMLEAVRGNDDGSIVRGINEEYLLNKGSNFIRRDAQQRVVFTHLSVREYLTDSDYPNSDRRFSLDAASRNLVAARSCMSTIILHEPCQADWEFLTSSLPSDWSFYSYCCTYWTQHLQSSENRDDESMRNTLGLYVRSIISRMPAVLLDREFYDQILHLYGAKDNGTLLIANTARKVESELVCETARERVNADSSENTESRWENNLRWHRRSKDFRRSGKSFANSSKLPQ